MTNKVSHTIKLVSTKAYSVAISGIIQLVTWVEAIRMSVGLTAAAAFLVSITRNISITNSISATARKLVRLTPNVAETLSVAVSRINQYTKLGSDIAKALVATGTSRARQVIQGTISGTLAQAATATVAQFILLSVHDVKTLGTMDTDTLGALDSTIVT